MGGWKRPGGLDRAASASVAAVSTSFCNVSLGAAELLPALRLLAPELSASTCPEYGRSVDHRVGQSVANALASTFRAAPVGIVGVSSLLR